MSVYELLVGPDLAENVDALAVLDEAFALGLSVNERFAGLLRLARTHLGVRAQIPQLVESAFGTSWQVQFDTFLGGQWAPPLLMAWTIGISDVDQTAELWDQRLLTWQNKTSFMPMFCADVGLSSEYAEFFFALGGPFVAALVGLANGRGEFTGVFLDVLVQGLGRLQPHWAGLQLALWTCHVAARLNREADFEVARTFIDQAGGVAPADLYHLPSTVAAGEGSRDDWFSSAELAPCPDIRAFLQALERLRAYPPSDATDLLLAVLDDDSFFFSWADPVLSALWHRAAC